MDNNSVICNLPIPPPLQDSVRMFSHPTLNENQKKELHNSTLKNIQKKELIEKEIRQQIGSICICNHSDIWCVYCYGEFDLFD